MKIVVGVGLMRLMVGMMIVGVGLMRLMVGIGLVV
jgi:hypothetical protein